MASGGRLFSPPRNILRVWLGSRQGLQTLVSGAAYQGLKAQPNSLGVRHRPASRLGFIKQRLVDIQRLFHMYDFAI